MHQAHLCSTEGSRESFRLELFREQSAARAALTTSPWPTAQHWKASRQQHLGHGPLLEAFTKHTALSDIFPHPCNRNRTGGSSTGPRVSVNRTTYRLLPGRGTGRQQYHSSPPHPPLWCYCAHAVLRFSPSASGPCFACAEAQWTSRFSKRGEALWDTRRLLLALTGSPPCWDHLWAELQGATSQQLTRMRKAVQKDGKQLAVGPCQRSEFEATLSYKSISWYTHQKKFNLNI